LYRFCLARGISEVRAAGSVAVYPKTWDVLDDQRPVDLNAPVHPGETSYAWSKRWAEILADIYRQQHGIHTLTFRLTNPFGPYDTLSENDAHVATAFIIRALSSAPKFSIRGNPDAKRDFVFAGDIAEIFRASLARRGVHEAMNLARGETTTVLALAVAAMTSAGTVRPIEVESVAVAGVSARRATAARLREVFPQLAAFHSLAQGLDRTVAWYRDALAR
jgi:nucleoside-diphosphate-sugar epimerase